jgi:hypothetical protein
MPACPQQPGSEQFDIILTFPDDFNIKPVDQQPLQLHIGSLIL